MVLDYGQDFGCGAANRDAAAPALRLGESVEVFAVGFARPVVGGGNAGAKEFARRERELIAELRLALGNGPSR
jgi:hypothetical protein